MYETHFGLKQRPFRTTPDCAAYYPATSHETTLAEVCQALADDEGMVLLTGAPGTGKTLLCHRLLEKFGADAASAFLTNSHFRDRVGLLQAILYDLSLPCDHGDEQRLRLALTDCLLKNLAGGRRTLVIVDEAQHLSADLLEELRLLGNLESAQRKAVQFVLAAQVSIESTLRRPELAALAQRLAARLRLGTLDEHEAVDFLVQQLRNAGGRSEQIFSDEALEVLVCAARGIPRRLNQTAHHSLVLAHRAGLKCVDVEVVLEACTHLNLEMPEEENGTLSVPPLSAGVDSVLPLEGPGSGADSNSRSNGRGHRPA